ncbi:hypothetical protein [Microvirga yunnanensis]|uniref:hypothetical protein n=1 Tax=Microvirga yunnanensis TaxID=2953740 RepID=UPI0021C71DF5|nr:hypothetical protein [Microvirga sp. HBU67655]
MSKIAALLIIGAIILGLAQQRRQERRREQRKAVIAAAADPSLAPYRSPEDAARIAMGVWDDDLTWPSQELH